MAQKRPGWFYHAPARVRNPEPVGVPPASQIPGLTELAPEPPEANIRTTFRESDSDYVRLAKQGGRQDLLQNNYASRGRSKEAVDYPRVDWYYLEDNQAADNNQAAQSKKDYRFMLPEYMVHDEYEDNNNNGNNFRPKRAPYGYDTTQVYERDTDPTKKDIKLPEVVRQGYGVRSEKLRHKPVPHNQPPPPKPIRQEESNKAYKNAPNTEGKERPDMSKILSFDYSREWQQSRDVSDTSSQSSWQRKHSASDKKPNSKMGDFASEYQMGFSKPPPKAGRRATPKSSEKGTLSPDMLGTSDDGRPPPKTAALAVKKEVDTDKELFKMSRFKNVAARTDSHRAQALAAGI